MADLKISALPASTTPLAGTEVLPVVQSSTTKQVSVANLTAGRDFAAKTLALTPPGNSFSLTSTASATSYNAASIANTGGSIYYGVDNIAGTAFNGLAYAGVIGTSNATAFEIFTNNVVRMTYGATGDVTVNTGNLVIGTSGKGIQGTTTNDSANAGVVGEFISSAVGGLVAMTTGTSQNATSISLTAGDWDVTGCIGFVPASTTSITALKGTIGTTSALYNDNSQYSFSDYYSAVVPGGSTTFYKTLPVQRISLASTTTVYLVAQATFGIAALYTGSCFIRARRVR